MTATTAIPTISDLIEFVYANPGSKASSVASEFNIDSVDAAEILNSLDDTDGTLYSDGEGYSVEDGEQELDDVLEAHKMGGGRDLDSELPVSKPKAKKKKAPKKKPANAKSTKKAPAKAKAKAAPKPKAKKKAAPKKAASKPSVIPTEGNEYLMDGDGVYRVLDVDGDTITLRKLSKNNRLLKASETTVYESTPEIFAEELSTGFFTPSGDKEATAAPTKAKKASAPKAEAKDKPKQKRVVKPRASRFIEDEGEAEALKVKVGTEVKTCVDCQNTYAKHGDKFRPRWRNPETNEHSKHVQPRCIDCDKLRSRRKSRFTGLRRVISVEDIGNAEEIVTHPDRKRGGVPDGKFSVALIDDTVAGFTPNLRGVLVTMSEGLIKLRWTSGSTPEIVGATKKAIAASKAKKPSIVIPTTKAAPKKASAPAKKKVKAKAKPKAKKAKAEESDTQEW